MTDLPTTLMTGEGWAVAYEHPDGSRTVGYLRVRDGQRFGRADVDATGGDGTAFTLTRTASGWARDGEPVTFERLVDVIRNVTHQSVTLTVVTIPAGTYSAGSATVAVAAHPHLTVTVSGPERAFGQDRPGAVNWSAIGSVDPATAQAYAAAISYAATVAPTLLPATGVQA